MLWFRTDETKEALQALELFGDSLKRVSDDVYFWKWCLVSLHNALQGFMILSLSGLGSHEYIEEKGEYLKFLSGEKLTKIFKPRYSPGVRDRGWKTEFFKILRSLRVSIEGVACSGRSKKGFLKDED